MSARAASGFCAVFGIARSCRFRGEITPSGPAGSGE